MGIHAFEDCAMTDVVDHLRFPFEIFEAGGRAEFGLHPHHERGHVAVSALVPIVVSPCVAHRPLVFSWNRRAERLQGGK